MADSGGGFFGGLAGGFNEGQTQALAQQKQDALEANQDRAAAAKQIDATIQHIKEVSQAAAAAGQDPRKIYAAVQPLISSAQLLAEKAGYDPNRVAQMAQLVTMRPAEKDDSGKKKIVTTSGGLGEPDRMHIFDEKTGTITPVDPKTGQPMGAPAAAPPAAPALTQSEVITPRQVQVANPAAAAPPAAPASAAVPQPAPQEDASLPPGAAPTAGPSPFDSRFAEPTAPAAMNHNVNHDVLDRYPPKAQALIKGVADGTIDPAKAFSKRIGKDGESELTKFLGAVKEYDPSFDTANAPARAATLKAFKTGVEARKLSALGTVVGHVTELAKEGQALDNWKSETFGPLTQSANKMRLWMQENKQSPIVTRFDNAATAVANELENAFRGNNTAISGIMEWRKGINASMASDQIAESTKVLGKLLLARMGELKEQWDRGMGHNQDPTIAIKLLKTRELLEKMSAGTLLTDRAATAPAPDKIQSLKDKYKLD